MEFGIFNLEAAAAIEAFRNNFAMCAYKICYYNGSMFHDIAWFFVGNDKALGSS